MQPKPGRISWEDFRTNMLAPAVPATLSLGGNPAVMLFVTAGAERMGIRVAVGPGAPPPAPCPIRQILVRMVQDGAQRILELSTTTAPLFREFFFLALSAADLMLSEKAAPAVAVERAIVAWRALLRAATRLSEEEILGVVGELWMLHRLIGAGGVQQVMTWTGPKADPHDFRLDRQEIEVKVTRKAQRVHLISGAGQLVASQGCALFVLSLQMEPAGGGDGRSLPDWVDQIREDLSRAPAELQRFNSMLETRTNYRQADADLYQDRYRLRTKPTLVPVDEACPRITRAFIDSSLGSPLAARIGHLLYEVNLDGLGYEDGTGPFLEVLPATEVG